MNQAQKLMTELLKDALGIEHHYGGVEFAPWRGHIHLHIIDITKNEGYLNILNKARILESKAIFILHGALTSIWKHESQWENSKKAPRANAVYVLVSLKLVLTFDPLILFDLLTPRYKKQQIEETQADRIILFRLGEFVDISEGPMVTNTGFIEPCRFVFTCVSFPKPELNVEPKW